MDLLRTALSTREKLAYKPVVQLQRGKRKRKVKVAGEELRKNSREIRRENLSFSFVVRAVGQNKERETANEGRKGKGCGMKGQRKY